MKKSKELQWLIDNEIITSVMYTSRNHKPYTVVSVYVSHANVKQFEDNDTDKAIELAYNHYREVISE